MVQEFESGARSISNKEIFDLLKTIKSELDFIKAHMVDVDALITREEGEIVREALNDYESGKVFTLDDIKRARKR